MSDQTPEPDDQDLPPADSTEWAEWAMEGEQRMLEQIGWGRNDC